MNLYEALTLLASCLAMIISTVSLVRTRRISEEQLKLGRVTAELSAYQIKEIEERQSLKDKPKIDVRLSRLGDKAELVIVNSGQGFAYNVNLELLDCNENPLYDAQYKLPCPELRPKSTIKLRASFHMSSPMQYQVKVSWRDSAGEQSDIFWVSR